MSSNTLLIKRQNHRIHPCDDARKKELLNRLITQNEGVNMVIVSTNIEDIQDILENENITIVNDEMLSKSPELKCELLISYDLPLQVEKYIARLSHTNKNALIVLGKSQESLLYPIETFMKRTIMQEIISGFETEIKEEVQEKRFEKKSYDKRSSKPKSSTYKKKDTTSKSSTPSKYKKNDNNSTYMGKDENGKAIFSKKSGERNHRYDGKPKTTKPQRTIKIKPKPKSD